MFAKIILLVSMLSMVMIGINRYSFRATKKRLEVKAEYSKMLLFILSVTFGTVFVAVYAIENGRTIASSLLEQYNVFFTGVLMVIMGMMILTGAILGLYVAGIFSGWAKYGYLCERFRSVLVVEVDEVVLDTDVDVKRENERRRVHRAR